MIEPPCFAEVDIFNTTAAYLKLKQLAGHFIFIIEADYSSTYVMETKL